jgi:hypothetical protein
LWLADYQLAC